MPGGLLPGGYVDGDGRLHREVELAALTGREEELVTQIRHPNPATLVTEVLSRCVRRLGEITPVPHEVARGLLVADRLYLMLRLRAETFGDRVLATLVCPWPECGQQVSLDLAISDVPVEVRPQAGRTHVMTLSLHAAGRPGCEVEFRLPTGADQEALSELLEENEGAALTALLARCLLRVADQGPPEESTVRALPALARKEIEDRMREVAPAVAQTMDTRCPECGRGFSAPFDVQRFFLGELRADGARLYEEVHHLAYHYHWGEGEIMAMPRERRQTYVELLADAIGDAHDRR